MTIDILSEIAGIKKRLKKLEDSQKPKPQKKRFEPPNLEEVRTYFIANGYNKETADRAFKYYSEGNWVDAKGDKIISWKQKMVGVWFKPENKVSSETKGSNLSATPIPKDFGVANPAAITRQQYLDEKKLNK